MSFCFLFLKRLIFLIRDWGCPSEFPYGYVGGEDYVRKQLKVSNVNKKAVRKLCQCIMWIMQWLEYAKDVQILI